jgi:hypothetical protein
MYSDGLIQFAHEQNPALGLKDDIKTTIENKITTKIAALTTVDSIIDYME